MKNVARLESGLHREFLRLPAYLYTHLLNAAYVNLIAASPAASEARGRDEEQVEFAQDILFLLVMIARTDALTDAAAILEHVRSMVQQEVFASSQVRAMAESLGVQELLPDCETETSNKSHSFIKSDLDPLIMWLQLRKLRKIVRELLPQEVDACIPISKLSDLLHHNHARLKSLVDARAVGCSIYRLDSAAYIQSEAYKMTEKPAKPPSFSLDWTKPIRAEIQTKADDAAAALFYRRAFRFLLCAPLPMVTGKGETANLLFCFLQATKHHWLETVLSALTFAGRTSDVVWDTLAESVPNNLIALFPWLHEDWTWDCRHDSLITSALRCAESGQAEEQAFWGLLAGCFKYAVSLCEDWEDMFLVACICAVRGTRQGPSGPPYACAEEMRKAAQSIDQLLKGSTSLHELPADVFDVIRNTGNGFGHSVLHSCCLRFRGVSMAQVLVDGAENLIASVSSDVGMEDLALAEVLIAAISSQLDLRDNATVKEGVNIQRRASLMEDADENSLRDMLNRLSALWVIGYCQKALLDQQQADEIENRNTFIIEVLSYQTAESRLMSVASLLECIASCSNTSLDYSSESLLTVLMTNYGTDIPLALYVTTTKTETDFKQLMDKLKNRQQTDNVMWHSRLMSYLQIMSFISDLVDETPDLLEPLRRIEEVLVEKDVNAVLIQRKTECECRDEIATTFYNFLLNLSCRTALMAALIEMYYFDRARCVSSQDGENGLPNESYFTPPIWGASARCDMEDSGRSSHRSDESDNGGCLIAWDCPEGSTVYISTHQKPILTTTVLQVLRQNTMRIVRSVASCIEKMDGCLWLNLKGEASPASVPYLEAKSMTDYIFASSNTSLHTERHLQEFLTTQKMDILWSSNGWFCPLHYLRQFHGLVLARSIPALVTECGVAACKEDASWHHVDSFNAWFRMTVAPYAMCNFFPLLGEYAQPAVASHGRVILESCRRELSFVFSLSLMGLINRLKNLLPEHSEIAERFQALRMDVSRAFKEAQVVKEALASSSSSLSI